MLYFSVILHMHLTSIEIQGFKSFANKTVLSFLPPKQGRHSITAIIGPNGSGKSNIADAIRWVMGEQSLKTLRGKKSDDVIFGGSETRAKLGLASVSLTIDNRDGKVPIDMDEVVLARRLYRDGTSEYIVNGQVTRLIDVQLLLARAQFGQGSYSIIGQGTIDRMLLQSAEERKDFFDEASGIKELQIKYHHATLKLARTREHMAQAELLIGEVSPRLKLLSRQVKKLEERQEVETSLREVQETYYATIASYHATRATEIEATLATCRERVEAQEKQLQTTQEALAVLARDTSSQDAFSALSRSYQAILEKKTNAERDRAIVEGKLHTEYRQVGAGDVSWMEEQIQTLDSELRTIRLEEESLAAALSEEKQAWERAKAAAQAATVEHMEVQHKLQMLELSLKDWRQEQHVFQAIGLRAIQAILDERERFGTVYGAVAQLGDVDAAFQVALDVAAGSHVSSLVVGDAAVAEACIAYLRAQELGVATFLPLTSIRPRGGRSVDGLIGLPGVHGRAIDLVRYDDRFQNIFGFVFGTTIVVEDIGVARRIGVGSARMVTLAGDLLEESGVMKGGWRRTKTTGLSFTNRQLSWGSAHNEERLKDMEGLQAQLTAAANARDQAETLVRDLANAVSLGESKRTMVRTNREAIETKKATLEQERAERTMSKEEYSVAMHAMREEKEAVLGTIDTLAHELVQVEAKIAAFHAGEEKKKQQVFTLQDEMQQIQVRVNTLRDEKNSAEVELAKLQTKLEDVDAELYAELHLSRLSLLERSVPTVPMEEIDTVQQDIQKYKYKLSLIGGIDEGVMAEFASTKERYDSILSQLTDLQTAIKDITVLAEELETLMKKKRERAFRTIKKEFSRYFELLFEGGKADLVEIWGERADATDADAAAEAEGTDEVVATEADGEAQNSKIKTQKFLQGIDVIASPPGKKIHHLQALSGGERTLTSIALICAILHTNPSPFVLLDEVEAALDEANTIRFTTILHELATASQFILISHNRASMHAADALYGVTMGADGVSQLVSVSLPAHTEAETAS